MTGQEQALARQRAYALFGTILLEGVTAAHLPYLAEIPPLSEALAQTSGETAALKALSAEYQSLFGFNVFPYQGVFLSSSGLVGGEEADKVCTHYQEASFAFTEFTESPEHLGVQLLFLAYLSAQESQAWTAANPAQIAHIQEQTCTFLDQNLLRWLPGLHHAISRHDSAFFTTLSTLVLDLALDHRQFLAHNRPTRVPEFSLPPPPPLLEHENTGLREIAAYLLVPAHCGLFLSRDDIRRLARSYRTPAGFGSRKVMLLNLMRSAAEYDHFAALLESLLTIVTGWQEMYHRLQQEPESSVSQIADTWLNRLSHTEQLLQRLHQKAELLSDEDVSS